jgi:hypothetical protein
MTRIILFISLVISNPLYCQVNSFKLDSLAKQIASSHKSTSSYQDSFIKAQDSTYRTAIDNGRKDSTRYDAGLLARKEQDEKSDESKMYVRPGITALLLALLIIGFLRLRRKRKQS